ncbi:unnamed protein product [Gordionus sp. m RMFG-2023]
MIINYSIQNAIIPGHSGYQEINNIQIETFTARFCDNNYSEPSDCKDPCSKENIGTCNATLVLCAPIYCNGTSNADFTDANTGDIAHCTKKMI